MELDLVTKNKLENLLDGYSLNELKNVSFEIINRYQNESGKGNVLINDELRSKVYAVTRFPATYKVVSDILEKSLQKYKNDIKTLIDFGSGSGSASLAAFNTFELEKITQLERDDSMINVGQSLFNDLPIKNVSQYFKFDLTKDELKEKGDLVISSYVLNELESKDRINSIKKMWEATNKFMVIIEPGTPIGSEIIKEVRSFVISLGGYVLSPCPHMNNCPIAKDDWCHFSTRVSRSKLHKALKEGDSPFEDEKYSYIIFSKKEVNRCKARILRHPLIYNGYVSLTVCDQNGIENIKISKKDKERYKLARKANVGDEI